MLFPRAVAGPRAPFTVGDVHGAIEQLAVDDVRKVEVDVDPNAGIGCKDLRPSLVAAGAHVELHLVAWQ